MSDDLSTQRKPIEPIEPRTHRTTEICKFVYSVYIPIFDMAILYKYS